MHVLILGITDTGKTTLAFRLSAAYSNSGHNVIVLDPDCRSNWTASKVTANPEEFLQIAKINTSCALFIDEGGLTMGRYCGPMEWLATNSRKFGHKAHFITQRASQLAPLVRAQCSELYLFKQSTADSKILSAEFVCEELKYACLLKKGQYLYKGGIDEPVKLARLWKEEI